MDHPVRSTQTRYGIGSGLRDAVPIMLGYLPIAFAYGVLAVQTGLGVGPTVVMSILVYAGASQFMAVSMIAAGGALPAIVLATLAVNSRHVLMSAALGSRLGPVSKTRLVAVGFHVTDETFALMATRSMAGLLPFSWVAGLQWGSYLSWVGGSLLGALAGRTLVDLGRFGLDFALTAMFIALTVMQVEGTATLIVAVGAALLFRLARLWVPAHWAILLAGAVAAGLGVLLTDVRPGERKVAATPGGRR